jgi:hypothetical protein
MKRYLLLMPMLFFTNCAFAQAEKPPEEVIPTTDPTVITPAETIASCQRATQKLGNNVIKGNYLYAHDKVYPRYKKRQVAVHGEKKYREQFLNIGKMLNKMGGTITNFKAEEPVGFFRVWPQIKPDAKLKLDRGEQKNLQAGDVVYNRLIIVPTIQEWIFRDNHGGPPRKLKREGFQVAIAQETVVPGEEQWTFIDGDALSPRDLRAMFPSLPQKLVLPKLLDSEIK